MGINKSKKSGAENAVGAELAAVLPQNAKPWYRTRHLIKLNLVLLIPIFSSGAVGFDGAIMNGLQTVKQWRDYFDTPDASILGTINAVYPVGKIIGLGPATWISDRYGRKKSLLLGFFLSVVGAVIQAAAQNLTTFVVARCFLGFGTAFMSQPSPIIITELAYPTHRGKITSLYNTFFYFGAILAAWSTYGTFRLNSTWSWRIPSLLQGAVPLIQLAFLYFLPESPRSLIARGKPEEARKFLVAYHTDNDESSPLVDYELREMQQNIQLEAQVTSEVSYLDLVRHPANRKRTLIAVILGFGAQWNGVGVVSYYLTLVLNNIGITETKDQALINGLLQVFNWIAAIFAGAMMVDRLGRRTLFLASCTGMLASYVVWTILTSVFARATDTGVGRGVVAMIFVFYFFYDIAWTPLLQAYVVEIFPYTLRGRGLTVCLFSTFIALIMGMFVNPIALSRIGWKYYIVFCCILTVITALVYFLFPETKGRSLEQIAEIFDGQNHTLGHVEKGPAAESEGKESSIEHEEKTIGSVRVERD